VKNFSSSGEEIEKLDDQKKSLLMNWKRSSSSWKSTKQREIYFSDIASRSESSVEFNTGSHESRKQDCKPIQKSGRTIH
jgi:hypothetical protein